MHRKIYLLAATAALTGAATAQPAPVPPIAPSPSVTDKKADPLSPQKAEQEPRPVAQELQKQASQGGPGTGTAPATEVVQVAPGDTLWGIADHYYGDGSLYHRLVTANPGTITDPDVISVGQVVRVPRTAG